MKTVKTLFFVLLVVLSCGGLSAADKLWGFPKPYVLVTAEPDAHFKDAANPVTAAGLEAYADALLAGGKVTHVFWYLSAALREKFTAAGVDAYKVLIERTQAKGAEAWVSIRLSEVLGPAPEYWREKVRAELQKAVVAIAKAYPNADGYELDFLNGLKGFSAVAPEGEKPFNLYDAARHYGSLRVRFIESTRKREPAIAFRIPADDAACDSLGLHHGTGGVGATLFLPCLTAEQAKTRAFCASDWHELDRVGVRILPGIPLGSLTKEEVSGWASSMRGWGFPGIVFTNVGEAPKDVRQAVCADGLADWNKTLSSARKIVVGAPLCDGTYEFALQEGTSVKKPVQVTVRGEKATAGEALLNGHRAQSSAKNGAAVTYSFAPDSVIARRNYLRLPAPAEGPVEIVFAAE